MDKIILKGRKVVAGMAEGEAFVTRDTISGWGGIDHTTGTIVEMRHEKRGQSFAGKVMVFNIMTTKVALGAVVVRAPAVTDLDQDPLGLIEDGDWVKVDGDNGIVEVTKKAT
jgi:predicted aconitase with swiveling domain